VRGLKGSSLDDPELVERARRGDVGAFEELVRRHQGLAVRAAYVVTGHRADAEDVAQAAFLKAYLALGRFRAGAAFRPWLLRIVRNEAKNRRRWAARHPELELTEAHDRSGGAPSPEEEAEAMERRRRLLAAVNRLRRGDREILAYRYFLDISEADMAEMMEVAPGTVKSRLARALERLRAVVARSETELEAARE
jgi:RNA polymerase sigma factor (sigma-70 family)